MSQPLQIIIQNDSSDALSSVTVWSEADVKKYRKLGLTGELILYGGA
jgi:hypothetical protein